MLNRWESWFYGAGDLGFNFVWQSIELYLLFYYIRELGMTPEVAAGIFLAGAVVDWMTDPLIGAVADRLAPRIPLRAWVSVGGPASVVLLYLAFAPPPVPPQWVPGYALATYLALRFAYGVGNIPYAALTARISADPGDHLVLTSARMQGAALGGLIAALTYALLPVGRAGADFRLGALILAGLAVPAFLATSWGTRERVAPPVTARVELGRTIVELFQLIVRSSALRRLAVTILLVGLSATLLNKSLLFLFEQAGAPGIGYYVAIAPSLSLLLTAPVWSKLAARIGQTATLQAGSVLLASAVLVAILSHGLAAMLVSVTVSIVAVQGMSVMFWSLVPGAVVACEQDAHAAGYAVRVYAVATITRKLAQALAPQLIALALFTRGGSILITLLVVALVAVLAVVFYPPVEERNAAPMT